MNEKTKGLLIDFFYPHEQNWTEQNKGEQSLNKKRAESEQNFTESMELKGPPIWDYTENELKIY